MEVLLAADRIDKTYYNVSVVYTLYLISADPLVERDGALRHVECMIYKFI